MCTWNVFEMLIGLLFTAAYDESSLIFKKKKNYTIRVPEQKYNKTSIKNKNKMTVTIER